jgi:hypothetical protein
MASLNQRAVQSSPGHIDGAADSNAPTALVFVSRRGTVPVTASADVEIEIGHVPGVGDLGGLHLDVQLP